MARKTFKYNPDSLHFEPVDKGCKGKIFRFILTFFGGFVCIFILYFVYINNFKTIKVRQIEKKNEVLISKYELLNQEIAKLELQLHGISKKDDNLYRAMLGKKALGEDLRDAGTGGIDKYEQFEKYQNYNLLKTTSQNLEILFNKIKIQENSFNEISKEVQEHQLIMNSKPNIQPISIKEFVRISSKFGFRIDPIHGNRRMHRGLDFAAPIGTKIYATGDGKVKLAGYNKHGYGNEIIIQHHGNYSTRYAHLQKIFVKKGEKVKRGQIIGLMGNSGKSTGPHLHYEVILNGCTDNPSKYYFNNLSVEEFEQIAKFSQEN